VVPRYSKAKMFAAHRESVGNAAVYHQKHLTTLAACAQHLFYDALSSDLPPKAVAILSPTFAAM
jgi:hypothetical protein